MTTVDIAHETQADRAVRCALAAAQANLRLAKVREVLDGPWTSDARDWLLAAIEGPVAS